MLMFYASWVEFAFFQARHDRSAHLRTTDWRSPELKVLVVSGEHVGTKDGKIRWHDVSAAPEGEWLLLGCVGDQRYAAVMVDRVATESVPLSLGELAPTLSPGEASLAVNAVGLAQWHQTHSYCGRCGALTGIIRAGHARQCSACGTEHFPRIEPAVIMLITDGADRVLLGRQRTWPEGKFSMLAGFVEPGETLTDAVRREVLEEVGIEVGHVEYAGSQPWPFPASLMLGFFGKAETHVIRVDDDEIVEARWFSRADIEELTQSGELTLYLSPTVSISYWLFEKWFANPVLPTSP